MTVAGAPDITGMSPPSTGFKIINEASGSMCSINYRFNLMSRISATNLHPSHPKTVRHIHIAITIKRSFFFIA